MRAAVMILGLYCATILLVASAFIEALSSATNLIDQELANWIANSDLAGWIDLSISDKVVARNVINFAHIGLVTSVLWLLACAFVTSYPLVSCGTFVMTAIMQLTATITESVSRGAFAILATVFAVLCFFAWREKRRSDDERKEMLAAATAILAMTGADSTTFQPSPAMYPGFQPPVVRPSNV